ncbi:MAG TPA: type II toxin-antitoxin system prevent-host-death family antitoxin [Ideonella sp.]|uniref:type II toxin-antitoxin system Phd/YefM family antitoxin n=1 Tax=Ideonella sp. TaxID=1929293 RepID=UPI002B7EFB88|nr:type II toxin-antitoxin system prevent-host-death family antitoxin [Ideonella sp.]HSI50139.1 type II toxin-antitoxin system prevent-host-death family antitoxin [Ideonella sp.]
MQVAIHELKAGLSKYLAQARAGEVIEVTSHNKPVARLVGIPQAEVPGLARLLASGAVQWSGEKPSLQPAVELTADGKTLGEMVAEDRA